MNQAVLLVLDMLEDFFSTELPSLQIFQEHV